MCREEGGGIKCGDDLASLVPGKGDSKRELTALLINYFSVRSCFAFWCRRTDGLLQDRYALARLLSTCGTSQLS